MEPKASERFFVRAESLGDFVGVVDRDVVDAAGVEVDRFRGEGGMDNRGAL